MHSNKTWCLVSPICSQFIKCIYVYTLNNIMHAGDVLAENEHDMQKMSGAGNEGCPYIKRTL